jgi:hypothetical protein
LLLLLFVVQLLLFCSCPSCVQLLTRLGFGKDDGYNIYDKRLFGDEREKALYKAPRREEGETYTSAQNLDEIATAKKFRPHKV